MTIDQNTETAVAGVVEAYRKYRDGIAASDITDVLTAAGILFHIVERNDDE